MPQLPYQFVIYGDSRTLSSSGSGQNSTSTTGYAGWLEAFSGQSFELLPHGNFAINGATNPEWRTLFANYAAADAPIAVLLIGLNSSAYSDSYQPLEQRKAQIAAMLDQLGQAGKRVFLITELPRATSSADQYALHQWLSDPGGALLNRPWISPVNVFEEMTAPGNPIQPNPDYFYDGIHLTPAGNMLLGQRLAEAMLREYPQVDRVHLSTSNGDLASAGNPTGNLIANAMLEGTGGTRGAGVTGAVATGWNLTASTGAGGVTVTTEKAVGADGFAEQVIHLSGTPSSSSATVTLAITVPLSGIEVGDRLRAAAMIAADVGTTGILGVTPTLFAVNPDGTSTVVRGMTPGSFGFALPTAGGFELPFATPELEILRNASSVQLQFIITLAPGAAVDGTIRLSQVSLRDYSSLNGPPINHAPDAVNDGGFTTAAGTAITIPIATLLGNDRDPDGNPMTVAAIGNALHGTVVRQGANIIFTPAAGYTGAASFTYTVHDGRALVDTATVSITVGAAPPPEQNRAPDAVNDGEYAVGYNAPFTMTAAQLLANDTDPDGNPLTITGVSGATGGSVSFANGQVVFTPTSGYSGAAAFTYAISDGRGGTDSATVTLRIAAPPGPVQWTGTIAAGTAPVFRAATEVYGLAGNDILRGSAYADVIVGGSGDDQLTGAAGADQFRFLGTEIEGASDLDKLYDLKFDEGDTLSFGGFGMGRFSADTGIAIASDGTATIQSWAGLVNLTQQGGAVVTRWGNTDALQIAIDTGAGQKQLIFVNNAWSLYSAALAADAGPANRAPDAIDDGEYAVAYDTPLTLTAAQLLGNDTDADGDALSITGVSAANGGSVSFANGQITFTPTAGRSGAASFSYTVSDGRGGSDTATVTLRIGAAPVTNRSPDAVNDGGYAVAYNTAFSVTAAQLLGNDTDPDGDTLTITAVGDAVGGAVSFANGRVSFTPTTGFSGPASFSYTVSDGRGGTDTASVTLRVAAAPGLVQWMGTSAADTSPTFRAATEILGLAGNDILRGSAFADIVAGGSGDDQMLGAAGADQFRFLGSEIEGASDLDKLYDLKFDEGDTLSFGNFGAGRFSADTGIAVAGDGTATIQSWAGLVNLTQQGNAVVTRWGNTDALQIAIDTGAGQKQLIFVNNAWSLYSTALAADPGRAAAPTVLKSAHPALLGAGDAFGGGAIAPTPPPFAGFGAEPPLFVGHPTAGIVGP